MKKKTKGKPKEEKKILKKGKILITNTGARKCYANYKKEDRTEVTGFIMTLILGYLHASWPQREKYPDGVGPRILFYNNIGG